MDEKGNNIILKSGKYCLMNIDKEGRHFWEFDESFGEFDDSDFNEYYDRWVEESDKFEIGGELKQYYQLTREEKEVFREKVKSEYNEAWESFEDFEDSYIYREIYIPEELIERFVDLLREGKVLEEYEGIGIYWGMSESSAKTYWDGKIRSDNEVKVLIEAVYDYDEVNWNATIFKLLEADKGENEIQLKKNQTVFITEIEINHEKYEINKEVITLNCPNLKRKKEIRRFKDLMDY